jgi:predicted nucleic acid-binding protein
LILVLDASAAVQIALNRSPLPELQAALEDAEIVLAPDLLIPEVTNAIWKYHEFEKLELDVCHQVLESSLGLVDHFAPGSELHREAFLLARTSRLPVYDMFYMALARREDATILTLDHAMRKEARRQGISVV